MLLSDYKKAPKIELPDCPPSGILLGRAVVLQVALGCADKVPEESEFQSLGALTSKNKNYSGETVSSDADDTMGFMEQFTTASNLEISVDGEVRVKDRLDEFGVTNLEMLFVESTKRGVNPAIWVRLWAGTSLLTGFMTITSFEVTSSTREIVTFSTSFAVADGRTISVELLVPDEPEPPPAP